MTKTPDTVSVSSAPCVVPPSSFLGSNLSLCNPSLLFSPQAEVLFLIDPLNGDAFVNTERKGGLWRFEKTSGCIPNEMVSVFSIPNPAGSGRVLVAKDDDEIRRIDPFNGLQELIDFPITASNDIKPVSIQVPYLRPEGFEVEWDSSKHAFVEPGTAKVPAEVQTYKEAMKTLKQQQGKVILSKLKEAKQNEEEDEKARELKKSPGAWIEL